MIEKPSNIRKKTDNHETTYEDFGRKKNVFNKMKIPQNQAEGGAVTAVTVGGEWRKAGQKANQSKPIASQSVH